VYNCSFLLSPPRWKDVPRSICLASVHFQRRIKRIPSLLDMSSPSSAAAADVEINSSTTTSWIPLTTAWPSQSGCDEALWSFQPNLVVGWDPGYGINVDTSLTCLPPGATTWWVSSISYILSAKTVQLTEHLKTDGCRNWRRQFHTDQSGTDNLPRSILHSHDERECRF
jgi:hypothetical protein